EDAFARYLPNLASQTVRPSGPQDFCGAEPDFKPSGQDIPDGLKNGQTPSVSAAPDGLTVWNGAEEGGARESVDLAQDLPAAETSAHPPKALDGHTNGQHVENSATMTVMCTTSPSTPRFPKRPDAL